MTDRGGGRRPEGGPIRPATILVAGMIVVAVVTAGVATWRLGRYAESVRRAEAREAGRRQGVIAVIPRPARLTAGTGAFTLTDRTPRQVEYMAFPRMTALAEVV